MGGLGPLGPRWTYVGRRVKAGAGVLKGTAAPAGDLRPQRAGGIAVRGFAPWAPCPPACFGPVFCRHPLRGLPNSLEGASLGRGWTIVGNVAPWGGGGSGSSPSTRDARRREGKAFGQPPRAVGWALWMAGLWLCYLPSSGRQPASSGRRIAEAAGAGFSSWGRQGLALVRECARPRRALGNREGESGLPPRGRPGPHGPVPCAGARPSRAPSQVSKHLSGRPPSGGRLVADPGAR